VRVDAPPFLKWCSYIIIFLIFALLPGCNRQTSPKEIAITKIFLAEKRLLEGYFSADINRAQKSLNAYLGELAVIDVSEEDDAKKTYYFGRAVALARLEFLIASRGKRPVDLRWAISVLRNANRTYEKLPERKMAELLIEIVRGDIQSVPWLKDFDAISSEAFAKVAQNDQVIP